jgi:hypothetical protein
VVEDGDGGGTSVVAGRVLGGVGGTGHDEYTSTAALETRSKSAAQLIIKGSHMHASIHKSHANIPILNIFMSSITHLDHPQTEPVPETAAMWHRKKRAQRSAERWSMYQYLHQKCPQRHNLHGRRLQYISVRIYKDASQERAKCFEIQQINFHNNAHSPPAKKASP